MYEKSPVSPPNELAEQILARSSQALQQLLQRDILWIGHHLKFDWSFLAQQFGVQLERVYDTMLVEKLLHVGDHVSASLLASAERYGITVTKEERP